MPHREFSNVRNYGLMRIGTAVNYVTRHIDTSSIAFDMRKLAALGGINSSKGVAKKSFQADAYSTKCQDAWTTEHTGKAHAGVPFCRVAVESHTQNSFSQLDTAAGSSLTISQYVIGYELGFVKLSEAQLLSCAYDEFRISLTKVVEAKDMKAWRIAYADFVREYGHGFVSTLRLISCATGEMKAGEKSAGVRQQQNYSRGTSGGGFCEFGEAGASKANGWAAEHARSGAKGQLEGDVVELPSPSPCGDWVSQVITKYTSAALPKIVENPPDIPAAPVLDVKPPEIPPLPPSEPSSPQPALPDEEKDKVEKDMQDEQMKEDGVDPETSWDDYQDGLCDEAEGLDKNVIAKESAELPTHAAIPDSDDFESARRADASAAADNVDFGDFAIYDVDFTPYTKVFPSLLKIRATPSRAALNLAKINMFIMTRQLIASYFNFVSSLPVKLTGGSVTSDYAAAFTAALKEYSEDYVTPTSTFNETKYRKLIGQFDKILQAKTQYGAFGFGDDAYRYVVDHFEFLSDAPYGFLLYGATADPISWYPKWNSWSAADSSDGYKLARWDSAPIPIRSVVDDAYRAFPIIAAPANAPTTMGFGFALYVPPKDQPKDQNGQPIVQDEQKDSWWWAIDADSMLVPGGRVAAYEMCLAPGFQRHFTASLVSADPRKRNLYYLSVKAIGSDMYFTRQSTDSHGNLPGYYVGLAPIGYEAVEGKTVHGIPMWYELPFESIRMSVSGSFNSMTAGS